MPPVTKAKAITLADLTDEDRVKLLEEAREAAKTNPTDVEGYNRLSDREQAIRGLMDARDHLRDCPVGVGKELGRIEGYDSRVPPRPDLGQPERFVAVIRCVECGGTSVLEAPLEEALEAQAAAINTEQED
jgi:hypothetical protein